MLHALRETDEQRALHGLARALVANAVQRRHRRASRRISTSWASAIAPKLKGKTVVFALGYSHPIEFPDPRGHSDHGREADAPDRDRRGSRPGRPGGRQYSRAASARSVQAEGHSPLGRAAEEEGRQGRRRQDRRVSGRAEARKRRRHVAQKPVSQTFAQRAPPARFTAACGSASSGTPERPRLCVYRSLGHIYAQVIDDLQRAHAGFGQFDRQGDAQADSRAAATWPRQRWSARRSPSAPARPESSRSCSIAAAISITAAWKLWPNAAREAGLKF